MVKIKDIVVSSIVVEIKSQQQGDPILEILKAMSQDHQSLEFYITGDWVPTYNDGLCVPNFYRALTSDYRRGTSFLIFYSSLFDEDIPWYEGDLFVTRDKNGNFWVCGKVSYLSIGEGWAPKLRWAISGNSHSFVEVGRN